MTRAEQLASPEKAERLAALAEITVAGGASADELQALAACLGAAHKSVQRRAAEAFAALRARGVPVDPVLRQTLHSDVQRQRWGAAYALSLADTPPPIVVLPVVLECLGSDDGDVRWAAASIVVRLSDQAGLAATLRELLCAGNPAQRKMAAYCLRDLDAHGAGVEQALVTSLDDPDPGVRLAAMSCLTRLSADRGMVAQCLLVRLGDADPGVRRAAAALLGVLGEPTEAVIRALRASAASPDLSLQRAAERSLRLLGS